MTPSNFLNNSRNFLKLGQIRTDDVFVHGNSRDEGKRLNRSAKAYAGAHRPEEGGSIGWELTQ
jgi:predicted acyltransferase (DUF342 family)